MRALPSIHAIARDRVGAAPISGNGVTTGAVLLTAMTASLGITSVFAETSATVLMTVAVPALLGLALVAALQERPVRALRIFMYLAPLEPAIRLRVEAFPYLLLPYALIGVAALMSLSVGQGLRVPAILFGAYALVEAIDGLRAGGGEFIRAVAIPTVALCGAFLISDRLRLSDADFRSVLSSFVAGSAGAAGIVLGTYAAGGTPVWTTESNFTASGDMGPNQMSFLFAAASFVAFVLSDRNVGERLLFKSVAVVFALLMLLTFSRGGMYLLIAAFSIYLGLRRGAGRRIATAASLLVAAVGLIAITGEITEGVIFNRLQDSSLGGRKLLLEDAYDMFMERPVLGVGTGGFYTEVAQVNRLGLTSGAHNELARAAAEHGIVGLVLWLSSMIAAGVVARKTPSREHSAFRLALIALVVGAMLYNGLKLIAISLLVIPALARSSTDLATAGGPSSDLRFVRRCWAPRRPLAHG